MKKIIALTVALIFISITAIHAQSDSSKPTDVKHNEKAITLVEYTKRIANKDRMVLVYFSAGSCAACIKMKPVVEQAEKKFSEEMEVLRMDPDRDEEVAGEFEINAVPVLMLYKNGLSQWTYSGLIDEMLLDSKIEFFDRKKVWSR